MGNGASGIQDAAMCGAVSDTVVQDANGDGGADASTAHRRRKSLHEITAGCANPETRDQLAEAASGYARKGRRFIDTRAVPACAMAGHAVLPDHIKPPIERTHSAGSAGDHSPLNLCTVMQGRNVADDDDTTVGGAPSQAGYSETYTDYTGYTEATTVNTMATTNVTELTDFRRRAAVSDDDKRSETSDLFARAMLKEVTNNPDTMTPKDMAAREKLLMKAQRERERRNLGGGVGVSCIRNDAVREAIRDLACGAGNGAAVPMPVGGGGGAGGVESLRVAGGGGVAAAAATDVVGGVGGAAAAPQTPGGTALPPNAMSENRAQVASSRREEAAGPYSVTIGLCLSRRHSSVGHPDTVTRQTTFDFNELQDRAYKYVSSTDSSGWRAGGGESGDDGAGAGAGAASAPSSTADSTTEGVGGDGQSIGCGSTVTGSNNQRHKVAAPDTVHIPIIQIDADSPAKIDAVVAAMAQGEIFIPHMSIMPEALSVNGVSPPDLVVRFGCERNDDLPPDEWPNWCLEFMHNQLYDYFAPMGARWSKRPFQITLARKVRWKTVKHMNKYFAQSEKVINAWREKGPQYLDPELTYIEGGATPAEVSRPHGVYLLRNDRATNYFAPNLEPPYTTKMTRSLLLNVIGKSWDPMRRDWSSEPSSSRLTTANRLISNILACNDPSAVMGDFRNAEETSSSAGGHNHHRGVPPVGAIASSAVSPASFTAASPASEGRVGGSSDARNESTANSSEPHPDNENKVSRQSAQSPASPDHRSTISSTAGGDQQKGGARNAGHSSPGKRSQASSDRSTYVDLTNVDFEFNDGTNVEEIKMVEEVKVKDLLKAKEVKELLKKNKELLKKQGLPKPKEGATGRDVATDANTAGGVEAKKVPKTDEKENVAVEKEKSEEEQGQQRLQSLLSEANLSLHNKSASSDVQKTTTPQATDSMPKKKSRKEKKKLRPSAAAKENETVAEKKENTREEVSEAKLERKTKEGEKKKKREKSNKKKQRDKAAPQSQKKETQKETELQQTTDKRHINEKEPLYSLTATTMNNSSVRSSSSFRSMGSQSPLSLAYSMDSTMLDAGQFAAATTAKEEAVTSSGTSVHSAPSVDGSNATSTSSKRRSRRKKKKDPGLIAILPSTSSLEPIPTDEELFAIGWAKAMDSNSGCYYYFTLDRTKTVWENPLVAGVGADSPMSQ